MCVREQLVRAFLLPDTDEKQVSKLGDSAFMHTDTVAILFKEDLRFLECVYT